MGNNQSSGFFNFKLGQLVLTAITDGHVYVKRVRPAATPESSPEEVAAARRAAIIDSVLMESFVPLDIVDGAVNMLLVKKDDKKILIDTGFGYMGNPAVKLPENLMVIPGIVRAAGKLLGNLHASGTSAEDITDILLTHAHIDHLGGLLDAHGNEVFKNACIHISQTEYDFWTSGNPDFSNSRAADNLPSATLARYTLGKVRHKLSFFNDGDILFDCMQAIIAPGHTPGQAMLRIYSGNEALLHIVDIAYNAELAFPQPEWGAILDADFNQAIATRRHYFEVLSQSRQRAFGCHLPWPGLGFVKKNGQAYQWIPQTFSTPQLFDDTPQDIAAIHTA